MKYEKSQRTHSSGHVDFHSLFITILAIYGKSMNQLQLENKVREFNADVMAFL